MNLDNEVRKCTNVDVSSDTCTSNSSEDIDYEIPNDPDMNGKHQFDSFQLLKQNNLKHLNSLTAINRFGYKLYRDDLERLLPRTWLNDKIINVYFSMIQERHTQRIYTFTTYFYNSLITKGVPWVQKWIENTNIFEKELLYFPVHKLDHWILIVVDLKRRVVEIFDSLHGNHSAIVKSINAFLKAEYEKLHNEEFRIMISNKSRIPRQNNGYDCGVYVCMYGKYRACSRFSFLNVNNVLWNFRDIIMQEIFVGRIVYSTFHSFDDLIFETHR